VKNFKLGRFFFPPQKRNFHQPVGKGKRGFPPPEKKQGGKIFFLFPWALSPRKKNETAQTPKSVNLVEKTRPPRPRSKINIPPGKQARVGVGKAVFGKKKSTMPSTKIDVVFSMVFFPPRKKPSLFLVPNRPRAGPGELIPGPPKRRPPFALQTPAGSPRPNS